MAPVHPFEPRESIEARGYLAAQASPQREHNASAAIQDRLTASSRRLVVLDDDPTGTQSVHGVPVLTTWSDEELRWAFHQEVSTFFILTNSRSLPEKEAEALNREIARRLLSVSAEVGTSFSIASRSDSTLRGHYPAEIDALRETLEAAGERIDGIIFCPCFLEAGRLTIDDVHWVRYGDSLTPAGQTEFASDANFGYSSSNLTAWIEEKTAGQISASDVLRIELRDIRVGGPERVAQLLSNVSDGQPVVVNAAEYADLELFVMGLLTSEDAGKSFLYRTGPSFIRARGGIEGKGSVGARELYGRRPKQGNGLVLVGSHVEMTTRQLERALSLEGLDAVEMLVGRLLDPGQRKEELDRVVNLVNQGLPEYDVIVYTSREVVETYGTRTGFEIGRSVSDALVEVMQRVDRKLPLSFVVAKGGITSSDVGTRGLGVRRAVVAGTMLPGIIPVWVLPDDSAFPGLPYVIFPGNVGGPDTLTEVIEILRRGT